MKKYSKAKVVYDETNIVKIISGGQNGADLGGLMAAKQLNIATGGTAPKGWRTSTGANPSLANYNLVEDDNSDYNHRTIKNVMDSDATIIFATNITSPGTALTIKACKTYNKPYLIITKSNQINTIKEWFNSTNIRVLNVAGNRDYNKAIHQSLAYQSLISAFSDKNQNK